MDTATAALAGRLARPQAVRLNEVPASLHALDRGLAQRAYRRTNIVAIGDSLFEGRDGSTYRNSLVPKLADELRARFPTPGQGGGGWSGGLDTIGSAWSIKGGTGPQDYIPVRTGGSENVTAAAPYGLGRRYSVLGTANATLAHTAVRCTGFDIEHERFIAGGSFEYSIDGGSFTTVGTGTTTTTTTGAIAIGATTFTVAAVPSDWYPGVTLSLEASGGQVESVFIQSISGNTITLKSPGAAKTHVSGVTVAAHANGGYFHQVRGLAEGSHTLTLRSSNAYPLGVDYLLNDEDRGVHIYNAGHAGIRADQLLSTGNTDHWVQSVVARRPDAIMCELYINDTTVQTASTYIANLTALRARVNTELADRGLPQPSWVQVVPYELDPGSTARPSGPQAVYLAALHEWARSDTSVGGSSGIFLVDGSRLMPRGDATSSGFYSGVHPIDAGIAALAKRVVAALPLSGEPSFS